MLDPATWLHLAQELPLGGRRRVNHDCGAGRTMIVKHGDNGWDAYCWRCSDKGFHQHPQPSMAERLARLQRVRQAEREAAADPRPPMPAEFNPAEWPLYARVWLYKAGFTNDDIRANGFYYCGRLDRVVLPVLNEGLLVYWQARGFNGNPVKYINPSVERSALAPLFVPSGQGSPVVLTLTEDLLSAIRIGRGGPARSLLGTALTDPVLLLVKAHRLPVGVWLDPDTAGRRAASKVVRQLRNHGLTAFKIESDKDPKLYSNEEIARWIQSSLQSYLAASDTSSGASVAGRPGQTSIDDEETPTYHLT